MTRVQGVCILVAPCCGARYSTPVYTSLNFMAYEYWTDGWRLGSLMPRGQALRRCKCGRLVLMRDLQALANAQSSDLPPIDRIRDETFADCVVEADIVDLQITARLGYWHYLNHPYRERYRQHREAEEAATKAAWLADHPDLRTRWDKFRGRQPEPYRRPPDSPVTFPGFEASDLQMDNMQRLSHLLASPVVSATGEYNMELVELYREQGRFDEATALAAGLSQERSGVILEVVAKLIEERCVAPRRYHG